MGIKQNDKTIYYGKTLHMTDVNGLFWLYDETRGMNLSMRAETQETAFVEALTYYQNRLAKVEKELKEITNKVDIFVDQFVDNNDNELY